jgi:maltooligosyltrehalose trehalohydrolase
VDYDEDASTVVLHRGRLRVVANLGGDVVNVDLHAEIDRILLSSEAAEGKAGALTLNPESFAIVALE